MRRELDHRGDFSQLFLLACVGWDHVLERVDGLVDWAVLEAVCGRCMRRRWGGRAILCGS